MDEMRARVLNLNEVHDAVARCWHGNAVGDWCDTTQLTKELNKLLTALPAAQTPASALREALVLFDELNTRTRLHHDPCRCPEAWPSKGGHYHPGCPKCRICKLESVLRLAATPQISEAEQHRNECENCGRSMAGENAVCLTCWNRVADVPCPEDDPENLLALCCEIADLMAKDHSKAVSRLREILRPEPRAALTEDEAHGQWREWLETKPRPELDFYEWAAKRFLWPERYDQKRLAAAAQPDKEAKAE